MNEVIIDGVNVAECQYYFYEDTEKAHTCRLIQVDDDLHYICKDNPNCYFKQLQRVKAENEELRNRMSAVTYYATGGRLSYSNYTLDAIEQAFQDQLEILSDQKAEELQAENKKLKEWLENKEKAYNHLCNANARKKEQIKNLNYMLFEEKEMTTQEWKLKYRLANKERKFIQYKEITNKRLNNYKQALEDIKNECTKPLNEKFSLNDFLNAKDEELTEVGIIQKNILKIINEVLND